MEIQLISPIQFQHLRKICSGSVNNPANNPVPLYLAHSLLSVPALEEDLFWIRVEQADHAKVVDNLGPGNVQFLVHKMFIRQNRHFSSKGCPALKFTETILFKALQLKRYRT